MTSRRNFLRTSTLGAGALALTPSLKALIQGSAANDTPKRFIFIRKSNGLRPAELALPTFSQKEKSMEVKKLPFETDLDGHDLPVWLRGLEAYKANMTILQGLSTKMSRNGHGSGASVMGCFKSEGNSLSSIKRATVDFELAKLSPSPFGHVELALRGDYKNFSSGILSGLSASGPQQRNYCYADPETAYNQLFECVTNPDAVNSDNAMLDFLRSDENFKAQMLNGYEKLKLSNHVLSIESLRKRNIELEKVSGNILKYLPKMDAIHAGGGLNANTPQKQEAMTEILTSALITGLTNVVTYTIDVLMTPVIGLPGNEGDRMSLHAIGHNEGYSDVPAEKIREQIRIGHMQQVAAMVERLKAEPEGSGTMFDNTMIMYFPEGGEAHHGQGTEAPFMILSGANCNLDIAGRYIRLPYHATEGHKTLGNWYTTLLNVHGNPIEHYGDLDLTMSRKKLDQMGSIKQFMP